jgi:hypothetical protein
LSREETTEEGKAMKDSKKRFNETYDPTVRAPIHELLARTEDGGAASWERIQKELEEREIRRGLKTPHPIVKSSDD